MLYPASEKKITVDQSKVLKIDCIDCSVFIGPPGIYRLSQKMINRNFSITNFQKIVN